MKYEMKLYKTFDADLISLNAAGISIPKLIRIALEHRARGKRARFFVTECPAYKLEGRRRIVHTSVTIIDRVSIDYLKREIKPRQRSAFFKAIVRDALVNQAVGVYFRNPETIKKENVFIQRQDLDDVDDLFIFKPRKRTREYAREIPLAAGDEADSGGTEKKSRMKNRFGDVSALSYDVQKKKREEAEQRKAAGRTDAVRSEPAEPVSSPADDAPPAEFNENGQTQMELDLMNLFENM